MNRLKGPKVASGRSSALADEQGRTKDSNSAHNANNAQKGGSEGPPSGRSADDRPREEKGGFAGKTRGKPAEADGSGPKNQYLPYTAPRVKKVLEKRSASSAASSQRLTDEAPEDDLFGADNPKCVHGPKDVCKECLPL